MIRSMNEKKAENKILFKKYNDAINQTFFDGRFANKPVFLDIEGKIQKEITERLDIEIYDLEEKLGNIISNLLFENSIFNGCREYAYRWKLYFLKLL